MRPANVNKFTTVSSALRSFHRPQFSSQVEVGSGSTESNRIFNGAQIFASFPAPPTPPFQLSVLAFLCLFPQCSNFHLPWSIKWAFCVCATDCLVSSFQPLPHANDRGPGGSSTNYHSYNPPPKIPGFFGPL